MGEYKYETTIETCVGYLIMILIGILYGLTPMYHASQLTPINNCVFNVFLPCLVLQGLRQRDFLHLEDQTWDFILAFLVLRVFLLIISFAFTVAKYIIYHYCHIDDSSMSSINNDNNGNNNNNDKKYDLWSVLGATLLDSISAWLGTSWISTIILGVPVLNALYGTPIYGVYAALSSFFFQLPLMIMFLEIQSTFAHDLPFIGNPSKNDEMNDSHKRKNENSVAKRQMKNNPNASDSQALLKEGPKNMNDNENVNDGNKLEIENENMNEANEATIELGLTSDHDKKKDENNANNEKSESEGANNPTNRKGKNKFSASDLRSLICRILTKILISFLKNPVIWAIVIGFILSFIYSGEDLDVTNDFPDWLNNALLTNTVDPSTGLGVCTTPVGVFVIGLFTSEKAIEWFKSYRNNNVSMNKRRSLAIFIELVCYLFIKFFIAPALMLGIAKNMFDLKGNVGRSAVIIATVPTSLASFTLTKRFELSTQTVMAFNVIVGTILMLPFVLMWLEIMDQNDYFV